MVVFNLFKKSFTEFAIMAKFNREDLDAIY